MFQVTNFPAISQLLQRSQMEYCSQPDCLGYLVTWLDEVGHVCLQVGRSVFGPMRWSCVCNACSLIGLNDGNWIIVDMSNNLDTVEFGRRRWWTGEQSAAPALHKIRRETADLWTVMCGTNEQNLVHKYSRITEKWWFSCSGVWVLFWRTLF